GGRVGKRTAGTTFNSTVQRGEVMFGRQPVADTTADAVVPNTAAGVTRQSADGRAPSQASQASIEPLLRPADWDRLSDADRAALLAPYPTVGPGGSPSGAGNQHDVSTHPTDTRGDRALQQWVAGLVAPQFQRDLTIGVRHWLESAPSDAHLFVGGDVATGRL